MRPVNLIPKDARTDGGRSRVGSVSFVIVAALALALIGAIVLGLTSKQVGDRENEVAQLERELQEVTARAQSLAAFKQFRDLQEARLATVSSLAQSRFDWERVLNELALVIPTDAWLIEMTGTVSPAVQIDGGADISIRDTVEGPALELVGCATGQDAVAGFVADLEDIDGVTRVGVASSKLPEEEATSAETAGTAVATDAAGDDNKECRTRNFISRFEIVVAFDSVPTPPTATAAPSVPATAAPATPTTEQAEVAGAQAEVDDATNLIPGG